MDALRALAKYINSEEWKNSKFFYEEQYGVISSQLLFHIAMARHPMDILARKFCQNVFAFMSEAYDDEDREYEKDHLLPEEIYEDELIFECIDHLGEKLPEYPAYEDFLCSEEWKNSTYYMSESEVTIDLICNVIFTLFNTDMLSRTLLQNIISYVLKNVSAQERMAVLKELLDEEIENEIVIGLIKDYGKEIELKEQ